jgi:hypothetical protein
MRTRTRPIWAKINGVRCDTIGTFQGGKRMVMTRQVVFPLRETGTHVENLQTTTQEGSAGKT